jgi:hypothetical protein
MINVHTFNLPNGTSSSDWSSRGHHLRIGIPALLAGGLILPSKLACPSLLTSSWPSRSWKLALLARKLLSLIGLRLETPENPPPGMPLMLPRWRPAVGCPSGEPARPALDPGRPTFDSVREIM